MALEDSKRSEHSLSMAAERMIGLQTWEASLGHGSFVTINIGPPHTTSMGHQQGSYFLWVYGARWEIRRDGNTLATSEASRDAMTEAAESLNGRSVRRLMADPQTLSLRLLLSGGLELVTTPEGDPDLEEWLLFLNDGNVLTAGPGIGLSLENASAASEDS